MTIQKNMLLCLLLIAGTYAYSSDNDTRSRMLTRRDADRIKEEVKRHLNGLNRNDELNREFHVIPRDVVEFIITNKKLSDVFFDIKLSETPELNCEKFNKIVDSYVWRK